MCKQTQIEQLARLLTNKKSYQFYADKLGVTPNEIKYLINEARDFKNGVHLVSSIRTKAKILLLDIETSPLLAFVFQKNVWKAKITHDKIISNWFILTWAAKWLGEEDVMSDRLSVEEVLLENDERLLRNLWELLDEADIVIAHNCPFDIPNINTRFVLHSIIPPSLYRQIDTLKIAQQNFGFTHNALGALAEFLKIETKQETSFQLWKDCIFGEEDALIKMENYNKQDIRVLENIFNILKPYAKGLPNLDLFEEESKMVCPTCGEDALEEIEGKYFYTQAVRYKTYRCTSCGAISRAKQGTPFLNKKLISQIPR